MSSFESDEFSFLDFIKLEIKNTLIILRDDIHLLQNPPMILSAANQGIKVAKELKKLFGMRPWSLIISLVENIERYFQAVQGGVHVIPSHLEVLEKGIKELFYLVDCEASQLEQHIYSHKDAMEDLSIQLAQFSQGIKYEKNEEIESIKKKSAIHSTNDPVNLTSNQHHSLDPTMFDLFCMEIDTQTKTLNDGLLEIEQKAQDPELLETLMRASHSIKGAARVVKFDAIVHLAYAMEKLFVGAQHDKMRIPPDKIDQLLQIVDFLHPLAKIGINHIFLWLDDQRAFIEALIQKLSYTNVKKSIDQDQKTVIPIEEKNISPKPVITFKKDIQNHETTVKSQSNSEHDRILRITAENFSRLMNLAGESLVESRSLNSLIQNLKDIKTGGEKIEDIFELLKMDLKESQLSPLTKLCLDDLNRQIAIFRLQTSQRVLELDDFIWRHAHLSDQLYDEAIKSRMRPFIDGVEIFPRMMRDLARYLGKQIRFEIEGKLTFVDREILEKLELPLNHLLRNAVEHGIETPVEREAAGKTADGIIKLDARHRGGMLVITVSDDGRGIDIETLRKEICERKLATEEMAGHLTEAEVIDFLFLSKFSFSNKQIEVSGRGMGLNSVQDFLQEVGGFIRTQSIVGMGTTFHLQLPITLSVIRALLVEIAGEAFALPLARIDQVSLLPLESIQMIENRQFFQLEEELIPLVSAWEVLDLHQPHLELNLLPVIILKEHLVSYALIVDRFIGEKELVIQELDARLGKIPDISAGALMEDGSPILILDIEDLLRSIDYLHAGGRLSKIAYPEDRAQLSKKRILVVDDSMTVREVESRLLTHHGYQVETAVNGVDGWNAIRLNQYDLIITDIDMPRMNGFELLQEIRKNSKFQHLPVVIVSYKEEEENRAKGLEAGANHYLTKNHLNDESLIPVVKELIGEP